MHTVSIPKNQQWTFMPWLVAICRNRLADGARRYARSAAHEIHVENMAVTFVANPAHNTMDNYGDVDELKEAIATLPQMQRDARRMLKLGVLYRKEAAV